MSGTDHLLAPDEAGTETLPLCVMWSLGSRKPGGRTSTELARDEEVL